MAPGSIAVGEEMSLLMQWRSRRSTLVVTSRWPNAESQFDLALLNDASRLRSSGVCCVGSGGRTGRTLRRELAADSKVKTFDFGVRGCALRYTETAELPTQRPV
ncbi:unnamed protein product [Pleuronectes platessa]|uniref:Uncharacterized protein n=1 Tax=Pleuronectes platessa TaxID=8262 RepID=A0A9N7VJY6_PLEPL|nr:unnamed protein product [Pleuronectes platessa]